MKFFSTEEYRNEFLNGVIYFNTVDNFARNSEKGRGDNTEGKTFVINIENPDMMSANLEQHNGEWFVIVRDYKNNPEQYKKGTVWDYSAAINRFRKICSLYMLRVDIENNQVEPISNKMTEEFGRYGIIVLNQELFLKRIEDYFKQNKEYVGFDMGKVVYLPQCENAGLVDYTLFLKRSEYEYQNEFRITFVGKQEIPIKINLGESLRDIVVPIDISQLKKSRLRILSYFLKSSFRWNLF